jgi:membrane protein DedA with SNARE-associated domain
MLDASSALALNLLDPHSLLSSFGALGVFLAGAVGVSTRTFTLWQILGGLAWSVGVTLAGYGLGSRIPGIDRYLLPIIAVVVILSLLPVLLELRRAPQVSDSSDVSPSS